MEVIYDGKIPMKVFLFENGFLFLILFGWNVGLIYAFLKSYGSYLKIDEEAVTYTKGIIAQSEERVELFRIKDTGYEQSILERLAGVGHITIFSDDATSPKLEIPIVTPKIILEQLRPLIRKDREHRRSINID